MKVVYFTVTGQTRRFAKKLNAEGFETIEINPTNPEFRMDEPFILITPTYEEAITAPVNDFLDYANNADHLQGIVGTGNRNFAELFIFTAKDLAAEYHAPIVYAFEFSGTPRDVANFKKVVNQLESQRNWCQPSNLLWFKQRN